MLYINKKETFYRIKKKVLKITFKNTFTYYNEYQQYNGLNQIKRQHKRLDSINSLEQ